MQALHKFAIVATIAAILFGGSLTYRAAADAPASAAAPPTRLAVINIITVFSRLNEKIDGDAEIEKLGKDINDQRRKKEDDLNKLTDALSPKHPQFKEDSPEYKKLQDEYLEAGMNYQAFLSVSEQKLLMLQRLKTAGIYRSMNAAIEKYAKANGIALVFVVDDIDVSAKDMRELTSKIAMRKVIYAHPNYDITGPIIETMNAEYRLGSHP